MYDMIDDKCAKTMKALSVNSESVFNPQRYGPASICKMIKFICNTIKVCNLARNIVYWSIIEYVVVVAVVQHRQNIGISCENLPEQNVFQLVMNSKNEKKTLASSHTQNVENKKKMRVKRRYAWREFVRTRTPKKRSSKKHAHKEK